MKLKRENIIKINKTGNVRITLIFRRVSATIVAEEKPRVLHIMSMCM
jgi:hypothetical protein